MQRDQCTLSVYVLRSTCLEKGKAVFTQGRKQIQSKGFETNGVSGSRLCSCKTCVSDALSGFTVQKREENSEPASKRYLVSTLLFLTSSPQVNSLISPHQFSQLQNKDTNICLMSSGMMEPASKNSWVSVVTFAPSSVFRNITQQLVVGHGGRIHTKKTSKWFKLGFWGFVFVF